LIAQEPLETRDASRLLVLERSGDRLRHTHISRLSGLLAPGDLLVVNRSRVFPARFLGARRDGGKAEVFLLRPGDDGTWEALLRPGRRLRVGDLIRVDPLLSFQVESGSRPPDGRRVVRPLAPGGQVEALLDRLGHTPLPPYVSRPDRPEDRERYQTVYAREKGSVAAPTAGLHFTESLLAELAGIGVERTELILHVGPGTFQPVKVEEVEKHTVSAEPFVIPQETADAIASARTRGGRVIAVGTTTARALETAGNPDGTVRPIEGETGLVITPGYSFRVVDGLLTNFHLPRSSLLLLVCAFAGRERVLGAYDQAIQNGYRFYSYGDAMLIL
jgi:S-adenosylmethionine:tRNA ribosyltransferase-isomerase